MRLSEMYAPTLREIPSDAEVISHQLMLRAGMIRRVAAGIYSYLPLALRAIRKVERIVREEMDRAGAQELLLPAVQPAELWRESGRWEDYGKELLRFRDRHEREFCLGPTHEEVITALVRDEVRSYRQLPMNLYQIQTKFRDEIRPRFGLMRGREFIMKDAYSFDADENGAEQSYARMMDAYSRIFHRCGLEFRAVEADTGTIGGTFSHEFMVLADTGEDVVVSCPKCGYAANLEKAQVSPPAGGDARPAPEAFLPLERIHTPDLRTVEQLTEALNLPATRLVKTMIFLADDHPIAVLARGDHEINEIKVRNELGVHHLELADPQVIERVTGAPMGFSGAVSLKLPVYADRAVESVVNALMGANETDYHVLNANPGRDYQVTRFADLRLARMGDTCPRCPETVQFHRGIEVGHIFKLGTKYSKQMNAVFLDADGKETFMVMGCYGIGVGRTVAAAIEQNHDENGIVWPMPLAPFHVYVLPIHVQDQSVREASEALYRELTLAGVETLLDDRDERPGVKFKDADLMGIPFRVTVGPKNLKMGLFEIRFRKSGEIHVVSVQETAEFIRNQLGRQLSSHP